MAKSLFCYDDGALQVYYTRNDLISEVNASLHVHQSFELYYFISGIGCYEIEGTVYPLEPGCLLLMRDSEAHMVHLQDGVPYERICINFPPDRMSHLSTELRALYRNRPLGTGNYFRPDEESSAFIAACLKRLCRDGKRKNYVAHAETVLGTLFLELFKIKEQASESESGALARAVATRGMDDRVRKVIDYIDENLTTIQSSDELASDLFFSKNYINRIFKRATGSSVWDYIVLKRLLLARSMLKEGKPATAVASACGFGDYSSFYRQYRQRFGTSPQAERKKK